MINVVLLCGWCKKNCQLKIPFIFALCSHQQVLKKKIIAKWLTDITTGRQIIVFEKLLIALRIAITSFERYSLKLINFDFKYRVNLIKK